MRLCPEIPVLVLSVLVGAAACVAPTGPSAEEVSSTEEAVLRVSELPPIPGATRELLTRVSLRLPYQIGAEDIGLFFPTRFYAHVPVNATCASVVAPASGQFAGTRVFSGASENVCVYAWTGIGAAHSYPVGTRANLGDFAGLRALVAHDEDIRPVRTLSESEAITPFAPALTDTSNRCSKNYLICFASALMPKCGEQCGPGIIAGFLDPLSGGQKSLLSVMTPSGPSPRALEFAPGDRQFLSFDTTSPAFRNAFGVVNPATSKFVISSSGPRRVMPTIELDKDYPGNDFPFLSGFFSTTDPLACVQACEANADCKAYTFTTVAVHGIAAGCWLKNEWRTNGVSTGVPKLGMISGKKP